jgi:hypothetical protein
MEDQIINFILNIDNARNHVLELCRRSPEPPEYSTKLHFSLGSRFAHYTWHQVRGGGVQLSSQHFLGPGAHFQWLLPFSIAYFVIKFQTESPILIKDYLPKLTRSEMFTIMVGGLSTIAGEV